MSNNGSLSQTELLAAATSVLCKHGFSEVDGVALARIDRGSHRLFEDAYSIVAVIAFPNWIELINGWIEAQASLVELMSEHLSRDEYKAWEGYLALLTPGLVPTAEQQQIERIRYDTGRVRKLISTGMQLREVSDVEDALLPLLPLQESMQDSSEDTVLSRLPELLQGPNLPSDSIRTVVDAFLKQEPLIESLHKHMGGK
ncbi:MAG: hypothetical protein O3C40_17070 [Planctomycetota bacterium]|nr:hypothetical protein [Planctomycetota bacterium]